MICDKTLEHSTENMRSILPEDILTDAAHACGAEMDNSVDGDDAVELFGCWRRLHRQCHCHLSIATSGRVSAEMPICHVFTLLDLVGDTKLRGKPELKHVATPREMKQAGRYDDHGLTCRCCRNRVGVSRLRLRIGCLDAIAVCGAGIEASVRPGIVIGGGAAHQGPSGHAVQGSFDEESGFSAAAIGPA